MNPDLFQFETIPAPPKIDPVPDGVQRPLFSVMIPVCNRIKYLRQTIESILGQDKGHEIMQICIVDNSTVTIDWDNFLSDHERRRIEVFRQPSPVRLCENWNTCVNLARGTWVHILHDDDYLLPQFYDRMQALVEQEPKVSAAFCRYVYADENDIWTSLGPLEMETPGILGEEFVSKLATLNCIQCPAVIVKHEVYSALGNFRSDLQFVLDWEMWARIAATYCWGFVPQCCAVYRVHSTSGTALFGNDQKLNDILKGSKIIQSHFNDLFAENARKKLVPILASIILLNAEKHYLKKEFSEARSLLIRHWKLCVKAGRIRNWLGIMKRTLLGSHLQ